MNFFHSVLPPKLIATAVAILFCVPSLPGQNSYFVSFSAPGACTAGGTFPVGINLSGTIAGYSEDCDKAPAGGFIREPNGAITGFSPTTLNDFRVQGINNSGEIVGYGAENSSYQFVSLLRDSDGRSTEFALPGPLATFGLALNNSGVVAGFYQDGQGNQGFIRNADGSFTVVDDPDAFLAPWEGTVAVAINDNGAVTGNYTDKNTGTQWGFIRDQFGNFTNFDAAVVSSGSTYPTAINLSGEVVGYYCLSATCGSILTGFLRSAAGIVTDIVLPGAVSTEITGINDSGVLVGVWRDSVGYEHGFQRNASGQFTEIAASGAFLTVIPTSINNNGKIAGNYTNEGFVTLGFVQ